MTGPGARALAAGLLLAAVAGCSVDPIGGTGAPAPKPALSDAPRVPDPRDLRGIPACDLLTTAQLEQLGFDPAGRRVEKILSTDNCLLDGRGLTSGVVTSAHQFEIGGLDRLYLNRDVIDVFIPGTLDGYPTVQETVEDTTLCQLNIGVADDQILATQAGTLAGHTGPSACDIARAMASAVLSNLPPLR